MRFQFLASSALALASMASAAQKAAAAPGEVRVEVSTLHNSKGHVLCALFDSEDAYVQGRPAMRVIADPMRPVATCIFHDVAPGVYMISAVHDENDDGKLDKSLFGAPKEGYAVSNNHTYILKGPDFKESSVELHDGPNTIELRLRYPGPDSTR